MIQLNTDARPPLINFVWKDVPNPRRTQEEGRRCFDNVLFVNVMAPGSKDVFEAPAKDYIANKRREMLNGGAFKEEWVRMLEVQMEKFQSGEDVQREGTPLSQCPLFTSAEVAEFKAAGITMQEDLAAVPDSGLQVLGLNGRVIRDKMRNFLQASKDNGALVEKVATLEADKATLAETVSRLTERMAEMEKALQMPEKRGPGRPRKDDTQ